MAEPFFQPKQPSRCPFTPEQKCEPFRYSSPMARMEFFADVIPQKVAVVLPVAHGAEAQHWDKMYQQIAQVWGDRRVSFQCARISADAWSVGQPCQDCQMVRQAQVVVIDLNNGLSPRTAIFLEMATASVTLLQQVAEAELFGDVPSKKIILINQGETNSVPSFYQYAFDYINYGNSAGNADLGLLQQKMLEIALKPDLFVQDEPITLDLSDLGLEAEPPHLTPAELTKTEVVFSERDEDFITIVGEELVQTEPEIAEKLKEAEAAEQRLKAFVQELQQFDITAEIDLIRQRAAFFEKIKELQTNKGYVQALQELYGYQPDDQAWRGYRQALIEECLNGMTIQEVVSFFFDTAVKDPKDRLTLSEWKTSGISTTVGIKDPELSKLLGTGEIPLRTYSYLQADQVSEWYNELIQENQPSKQAVILVVENSDEINVGLRLLGCREKDPSVNFIEFRLSYMKKSIREGQDSFEHVRKQIREYYSSTASDLYNRSIKKVVSEDGEFFGRKELIDQLVQCLESGEHFFVFGLRRTGKTSLLKRLQKLNQLDDYLLVDIDVQVSSPTTIEQLYDLVIRAIRNRLQNKYPAQQFPLDKYPMLDLIRYPLFQLGSNASHTQYRQHFVHDMADLLTGLQAMPTVSKVVLLLDEVETIFPDKKNGEPGIPEYREFLKQLRALGIEKKEFVIGMVAFGPLLDQELEDHDSPIYNQFHRLPLGMLTEEECQEMIETIGHRMHVYYAPGSCSVIFNLSGGDPQLTKYLCSAIFSARNQKHGIIDEDDIRRGVEHFFSQSDHTRRIKDIYERFFVPYFGDEAMILQTTAEKIQKIGEEIDLVQSGLLTHFTDTQLQAACRRLCDYGLLERVEQNYRIQLGLLHLWLNPALQRQYTSIK